MTKQYRRETLDAIKADGDILKSELVPSQTAGKYPYLCPSCGRKGRVRTWAAGDDEHISKAARWHCQGCNSSGTVVDAVAARDGTEAGAAIRYLLDKWGDKPPARPQVGEQSKRVLEADGGDDGKGKSAGRGDDNPGWRRAYCQQAAERLWTWTGAQGLEYLHGRGFDDETIRRFRLGYDARCTVGGVLKYGRPSIVIPYSRAGDFYTARFIRPMTDKSGNETKCLNCRGDVPVYNAPALWAGYDVIIAVEGWADAISIAQAGETFNGVKVAAIATGGASNCGALVHILGEKPTRARLLIAFDDDDAGRQGGRELASKLQAVGQPCEAIDGAWAGRHDANDVLTAVDDIELVFAIWAAIRKGAAGDIRPQVGSVANVVSGS